MPLELLDPTDPGNLTSRDVADLVGVTYRQLDYWCRVGLLGDELAHPGGPGSRRAWSPEVIGRLRLLVALRATGIDPSVLRGPLLEALDAYDAAGQPSAGYALVMADGAIVTTRTGPLDLEHIGPAVVVPLVAIAG